MTGFWIIVLIIIFFVAITHKTKELDEKINQQNNSGLNTNDSAMKTINWRKTITYIILSSIFVLYIFAVVNHSSESAKQVVSEYERRKHEAIFYMVLQNYDDLVINDELINYSMIRDKYNMKWYEKTSYADEIKSMGRGFSWGSSYSLFNWALLNAQVSPTFHDEKNPIFRENRERFDRIVVLRKIDGEWMIYKDIIDYDENDISFWQLFDRDYLQNKIDIYNDFILNIMTKTQELRSGYSGDYEGAMLDAW